ncbi:DUF4126 domain-containing protein [Herbiconiux sp. L3-i23]|uniref:DUF4126 domain-containing protein n=1 Tax=Herbiconiux sp. L3-i23 TaxID=2905871 RepID=UPI002047A287|nr:DUF4126 domain-containing protein [Herbiconiux sp. L3-i23]BDI23357.1 hypothetical protein L3i23_21330 [Herbiconiux sp. L3-i23]
MLEAIAGTGLAAAAGLNAYIPLLALGLLSRFTDLVVLPGGWSWLENEWALGVCGVLFVLEIVADKIPAVDSVNDLLQSVVRPASGGIVFGSGTSAQTAAIEDPGTFFTSGSWVPVAIGVGVALAVHVVKAIARAAANTVTAGVAAPVLSVAEDIASVFLVIAAIVLPVLVILLLAGVVVGFVVLVRRTAARRRAKRRASAAAQPT